MGVDKYWWLNQVTYASTWPEKILTTSLMRLSLLSDLSDTEESGVETLNKTSLKSCYKNRRRKAAAVLTIVWSGTIVHLVSWGSWFILGLTTMFGIHALRVVFARPHREPEQTLNDPLVDCPYISPASGGEKMRKR